MTDDLLMTLVAHASYPCMHSDFSMHHQITKASHFRSAKKMFKNLKKNKNVQETVL